MVKQIIEKNNIKPETDIVMLFLTMTSDLRSFNASSAIRQGMDWQHVPFFTSQEPEITWNASKMYPNFNTSVIYL